MAKRDGGEPVDADMDVGFCFLTSRNIQIAPAWRATAHEDRIPALLDQAFEAVDALIAAKFDSEIENVVALFIDDRFGKAKAGDLGADHSPGLGVLIENDTVVTERS